MDDNGTFESRVLREFEDLRAKIDALETFHRTRGRIFEEAYRISQTHAILHRLLYIALENISLEGMLQKFIYEVTSLSWLALQSKGAIFLVDGDPGF